jgi:hypothetical protein
LFGTATDKEELQMDKFAKMMEEAITHLSILCGCNVENSESGVHDALEKVFAKGSYGDGAKAVMIVSQWMWAHCETRYHSNNEK